MKWAHRVDDIPKEPHYAVVEQRSINIPGDERSRTHPGHGYPESTEQVWDYIVFSDRASWEADIKRREAKVYKSQYLALEARPATITSTVHIQVDIK